MKSRLVSNGCSYMWNYAQGSGHEDLAHELKIQQAHSLAQCGSANSRILRTTIRDALCNPPTLYIIGLSFISRHDYPISAQILDQDGPWLAMQNLPPDINIDRCVPGISHQDVSDIFKVKQKLCVYGSFWYFDELQLHLKCLILALRGLGHTCAIFFSAEQQHLNWLDDHRFQDIIKFPEFVHGLQWLSVPWQHDQGVPCQYDDRIDGIFRHRQQGEHKKFNDFLAAYIINNNLL